MPPSAGSVVDARIRRPARTLGSLIRSIGDSSSRIRPLVTSVTLQTPVGPASTSRLRITCWSNAALGGQPRDSQSHTRAM
jgi:hypothetical protein